MKYGNYRDGFFLPNELFQLGLDYGELAVYSFLKRCENRKTHQCWPSIKTIGQAVGMSENTVRKYIRRLEERLKKLSAEEKKDDLLTFEQLGVDMMMVDEAHFFKNCFVFSQPASSPISSMGISLMGFGL